MKISEIFESIQGEGKFVGTPMLFIRMSGCNLDCEYCDSKYSRSVGKEVSVTALVALIDQSNPTHVCWTGGEPTLQMSDINDVIKATKGKYHTLETNGTQIGFDTSLFTHITVSPKYRRDAKYWKYGMVDVSIKVVTDLKKVNIELLEYADYLMPLTTFDENVMENKIYRKEKDNRIKRRVWNYCIEHNIKYSPRLQVDLWGNERGR